MAHPLRVRRLHGPILVIAPHPDDEVLSSAGLIQQAVSSGIPVYLLFLTLGDGYRLALRRYFHKAATPKRYRKLGRVRYKEALAAASYLGLPEGHVFALGYPDGSLMSIVKSGSSRTARRSRFTRQKRVPYSFAVRPGAKYSRRWLVHLLRKIFRKVRPQTVVLPHGADRHPDHRASRWLAYKAMRREGMKPEVFRYLIHYSRWPSKRGALKPPRRLGSGRVYRLRLSAEEQHRKRNAYRIHRSQWQSSTFVKRLIRKQELFWKK